MMVKKTCVEQRQKQTSTANLFRSLSVPPFTPDWESVWRGPTQRSASITMYENIAAYGECNESPWSIISTTLSTILNFVIRRKQFKSVISNIEPFSWVEALCSHGFYLQPVKWCSNNWNCFDSLKNPFFVLLMKIVSSVRWNLHRNAYLEPGAPTPSMCNVPSTFVSLRSKLPHSSDRKNRFWLLSRRSIWFKLKLIDNDRFLDCFIMISTRLAFYCLLRSIKPLASGARTPWMNDNLICGH